MSAGTDTKANTWGGGALELGDSRLFEDCSKRGGALVSDVVGPETASEGWRGDGERVSVSTGADRKAKKRGRGLRRTGHWSLAIFVSLRTAAIAVAPLSPILLNPRLRARSRMGNGERVRVSMGADKTLSWV